jgi:hypothetical protein
MVGITGTSGSVLGLRLIEELLRAGHRTGVMVSDAGWKTLGHELSPAERKTLRFIWPDREPGLDRLPLSGNDVNGRQTIMNFEEVMGGGKAIFNDFMKVVIVK